MYRNRVYIYTKRNEKLKKKIIIKNEAIQFRSISRLFFFWGFYSTKWLKVPKNARIKKESINCCYCEWKRNQIKLVRRIDFSTECGYLCVWCEWHVSNMKSIEITRRVLSPNLVYRILASLVVTAIISSIASVVWECCNDIERGRDGSIGISRATNSLFRVDVNLQL